MKKAVIGIVSKHYASYKNDRTDTYVRDEIKQAIFDNGAVAIAILPPDKDIKYIGDNWKEDLQGKEYDDLISQIRLCDGIIFQGGAESDNYECIVSNIVMKIIYLLLEFVVDKISLLELLVVQLIK